jgi:divinyl protochlorophyllide a 8-vinyl-reductase
MSGAREPGRIGPNAIIRIGEALMAIEGTSKAACVYSRADLSAYLGSPPTAMVEETEVARLMAALQTELGPERARTIGWMAGLRTGDYVLKHRIPLAAQRLLALLPSALAGRVLAAAIRRHAWTFAGSAEIEICGSNPLRVTFHGSPLCCDRLAQGPACAFYRATFERLFRALVHPDARVSEVPRDCISDGQYAFEIGLS